MESEDIEDGEILEDESNSNEPTFPNKEFNDYETFEQKIRYEVKNTFDNFFAHKEKRNHHESHKNPRRERSSFPDLPRKRRRMDDDEGCIRNEKMYYDKNNKSNFEVSGIKSYDEEDSDDEMIFVLGGSLKDTEKRHKAMKKDAPSELPKEIMDSMMYNEGENEDSRSYSKRSPIRRDNYKKDRNRSRGPERCHIGMAKRRGRGGSGGGMLRKGKPRDRDDTNDSCSFYNQNKSQRGNEPVYSHQYSMPRKLEVCKFYLNDCCTKRDKCIYMHNDFPCKYHHTPGLTCHLGKNCKFSHSKLDEIQRAVLKKYADIPCKEIDDMQRFHRENDGNATYSAHKEKKEAANANPNNQNSRIPSLFDVKIAVPPEFRVSKEDDEEGGSTPMPSPQSASQMYDEDESDATAFNKTNNIPSDHNDRHTETTDGEETDRKLSNEDDNQRNHFKKKSKKGDDHSDGEKRKHSDKRKKRSKKEDRKAEKEKKKKHEQKQVENTYSDVFPELEEPPWDLDLDKEPGKEVPVLPSVPSSAPAIVDEQESSKHEQKEQSDALSHLPKKQQELFLRIQQHQKEAETSQNANIDEKEDEDDNKQDVNWYSSDEEEEPEKSENSSALATILRTIKTNSNNVPADQKSNSSDLLNTHLPANSSTPTQETDSVMVDASQLANIDLSEEVTQILTSIMKTDSSSGNQPISSDPSTSTSKNNNLAPSTRRPSDDKSYKMERITSSAISSSEDVDLRYLNANSILNTALFASNHESNPNKDIDFRTLPFKPVPIHDAATEINASITAHPPMEYKLTPLPFIPRVNYASMIDVAKVCINDPRFKRKLPASAENSENAHVIPPFLPVDPRQALSLKTMNEGPRADPRLVDPRKMDRVDPRLDNKNLALKHDQRSDPRMIEAKLTDKEQVRPVDFRDPRLKSCKFPEMPMPFPMITPLPPPMAPDMTQMPIRKEDPRLRFRANQK